MTDVFLTRKAIQDIPAELLPMPVLSDNLRSFLAWGIKAHTKGSYNHFMWLVKPGMLASQNILFSLEPVENYFDKCRLKFWYNPNWTKEQREQIIKALEDRAALPWYKRLYDVPAIAGQLFWHGFQVPGFDICSDDGRYIKIGDAEYDLRHPDPATVNRWLEAHPTYQVYGRYVPD